MASMFWFATRAFRTRSTGRDTETDRLRLMSIRSAIVGALDAAARERDGLQRRVEAYFDSASHILDYSEYTERSAEDEAAVVKAERQGSAGLNRIAAIDAQIARLDSLLAFFDDQQRDLGAAQPVRSTAPRRKNVSA